MRTWPPTVADVKEDAAIPVDTDDARLQMTVDAAVAWVQGKRKRFNYDNDPQSDLPAPPDDLWLGTVRLAGRWHTRRRAAAGQIYGGDGASDTVPYVDPDLAQLLGIGKWAKGAFA
jgi:hypothetical protein